MERYLLLWEVYNNKGKLSHQGWKQCKSAEEVSKYSDKIWEYENHYGRDIGLQRWILSIRENEMMSIGAFEELHGISNQEE